MNRVTSAEPIEKPCQLMTVPGVLVMFSALPAWLKTALPEITVGFVGADWALPANADDTASATRLRRSLREGVKQRALDTVFLQIARSRPPARANRAKPYNSIRYIQESELNILNQS